MEARTFVIEKIDGPTLDGKVTITAKDVLKLADAVKAQCPAISNGRLSAAITDSATSLTLTPSGIGDDEYPAGGHLNIGNKEIVSFTRSGDTVTITNRAQFGTEAAAHDQGDLVQVCKEFFDGSNGLDPADIVYDLLVNYADVPASWITLADWQEKTEQFIGRLYYTLVATPTDVDDLLNEIIEQAGLIIYTDDINKQIRLDVVRELTAQATSFDDSNTVQGSFDWSEQPDKRLSQVWVWYGQRNPLEGLDDVTNYSSSVAVADSPAESAYGQKAIKKIYSRWIASTSRPTASDLCYKLLSRFRDPPKEFVWSVWRTAEMQVSLAVRYTIEAAPIQTASGARATIPVQVTKLNPGGAVYEVHGQEISWHTYDDQPDQGLIVVIDSNAVDINFRDEYDKQYAAPESGDEIVCLIESGVVVGASTTSGYAFMVGTWEEAGITLKLINRGYIVGRGGNGGNGVDGDGKDGKDGKPGGSAFYTRHSIEVDNEDGTIGGGGGGGGSGAGGMDGLVDELGSGGGGGGAGYLFSAGGLGGEGTGAAGNDDGDPGQQGAVATGGAGGQGGRGMNDAGDGGDGGDLGQVGQNGQDNEAENSSGGSGGAAGDAVDGDSYVTWTNLGTVSGSRVN